MRAWQANMNIQFVDAYTSVMYIASYMMKNEKGMSELLKQVGNESRSEDRAIETSWICIFSQPRSKYTGNSIQVAFHTNDTTEQISYLPQHKHT